MKWQINSNGEYACNYQDPHKIEEVDTYGLIAYGIKVLSRDGRVNEIIGMLQFLECVHSTHANSLRMIESVFCDGRNGILNIDLRADRVCEAWGRGLARTLADECAGFNPNVMVTVHGPGTANAEAWGAGC
jgi:hypothetical protein